MKLLWAVVGGIALAVGYTYWEGQQAERERDEARAEARASAAQAPLYRWRDGNGAVHITDTPPPKGRRYERVSRAPKEVIVVHDAPPRHE